MSFIHVFLITFYLKIRYEITNGDNGAILKKENINKKSRY